MAGLHPHSLQMRGEGFPAARLCSRQGMVGGVKLGEGCQKSNGLWSPLLQAPSSSFSQSFPAPLHCVLQDKFFVCQVSPPRHALAPRQRLSRAGGMQRDGEGGYRLFVRGSGKAASQTGCWLVFHQAPHSLEDLFCHLRAGASSAPSCSTSPARGLQGKGTAKRRREDRDEALRETHLLSLSPCPS